MEKLGLPISRFVWYLDGGEVHFSLNPILVRLPFLLLALWFYREFAAKEQEENGSFVRSDADFLLIMMVAELVTAEMRVTGRHSSYWQLRYPGNADLKLHSKSAYRPPSSGLH